LLRLDLVDQIEVGLIEEVVRQLFQALLPPRDVGRYKIDVLHQVSVGVDLLPIVGKRLINILLRVQSILRVIVGVEPLNGGRRVVLIGATFLECGHCLFMHFDLVVLVELEFQVGRLLPSRRDVFPLELHFLELSIECLDRILSLRNLVVLLNVLLQAK